MHRTRSVDRVPVAPGGYAPRYYGGAGLGGPPALPPAAGAGRYPPYARGGPEYAPYYSSVGGPPPLPQRPPGGTGSGWGRNPRGCEWMEDPVGLAPPQQDGRPLKRADSATPREKGTLLEHARVRDVGAFAGLPSAAAGPQLIADGGSGGVPMPTPYLPEPSMAKQLLHGGNLKSYSHLQGRIPQQQQQQQQQFPPNMMFPEQGMYAPPPEHYSSMGLYPPPSPPDGVYYMPNSQAYPAQFHPQGAAQMPCWLPQQQPMPPHMFHQQYKPKPKPRLLASEYLPVRVIGRVVVTHRPIEMARNVPRNSGSSRPTVPLLGPAGCVSLYMKGQQLKGVVTDTLQFSGYKGGPPLAQPSEPFAVVLYHDNFILEASPPSVTRYFARRLGVAGVDPRKDLGIDSASDMLWGWAREMYSSVESNSTLLHYCETRRSARLAECERLFSTLRKAGFWSAPSLGPGRRHGRSTDSDKGGFDVGSDGPTTFSGEKDPYCWYQLLSLLLDDRRLMGRATALSRHSETRETGQSGGGGQASEAHVLAVKSSQVTIGGGTNDADAAHPTQDSNADSDNDGTEVSESESLDDWDFGSVEIDPDIFDYPELKSVYDALITRPFVSEFLDDIEKAVCGQLGAQPLWCCEDDGSGSSPLSPVRKQLVVPPLPLPLPAPDGADLRPSGARLDAPRRAPSFPWAAAPGAASGRHGELQAPSLQAAPERGDRSPLMRRSLGSTESPAGLPSSGSALAEGRTAGAVLPRRPAPPGAANLPNEVFHGRAHSNAAERASPLVDVLRLPTAATENTPANSYRKKTTDGDDDKRNNADFNADDISLLQPESTPDAAGGVIEEMQ
eukprot:GHVT01050158.1.p1 GENE.GHVT01050158.1~~GHVT01050158.1.p1  ORF type:complete len:839 (+),score=203.42 GHVT01050158.1:470-2986(+)